MVVLYYNEDGYNYCGNDGAWILRELKTVRGVLNRLSKAVKPLKQTKAFAIISDYDWDKRHYEDYVHLDNVKKFALYVQEL